MTSHETLKDKLIEKKKNVPEEDSSRCATLVKK